jgi:hypothetical protein
MLYEENGEYEPAMIPPNTARGLAILQVVYEID